MNPYDLTSAQQFEHNVMSNTKPIESRRFPETLCPQLSVRLCGRGYQILAVSCRAWVPSFATDVLRAFCNQESNRLADMKEELRVGLELEFARRLGLKTVH